MFYGSPILYHLKKNMRSYQPQLVTSCPSFSENPNPFNNASFNSPRKSLGVTRSLVVIPGFFLVNKLVSLNKAVFVLCTLMPC